MYKFEYKEVSIVALSDTHGSHRDIIIPKCDILIHVGDACQNGDQVQLNDFFLWMTEQPGTYKIFIPGNHDLPFEFYPEMAEKSIPSDVLFLQNSIIDLYGITIIGIEASPYMLYDVEIDEPVDIILSHGSPHGISGNNGCTKLLELIYTIKPKISLFGHIHSPRQRVVECNGIQFINVSQ